MIALRVNYMLMISYISLIEYTSSCLIRNRPFFSTTRKGPRILFSQNKWAILMSTAIFVPDRRLQIRGYFDFFGRQDEIKLNNNRLELHLKIYIYIYIHQQLNQLNFPEP